MEPLRNLAAITASIFFLLLLLLLLCLAAPLWVISSLTRAVTRLIQPKYIHWRDLIDFYPTVGWKPKPNLNTHYVALGGDICHILTDSHGWPGKNSLCESDIVVFGDSFAFGYGVNTSDSYMEINSHLKIKPIASPGYNMIQELILMRQLSPQLADKLVVWFICLENDLYDNLMPNSPHFFYRTPLVRRLNGGVEWEIVTNHVNATKWPYPPLNRPYGPMFSKLCTPSPLSQHVYSACNFLIREGRDICNQVGAHLTIMTIPKKLQLSEDGVKSIASHLSSRDGFDADYPDQKFSELCLKLGVPFIAAKKHLHMSDYKEYDWHWTKEGHRTIAKLIAVLYGAHYSGDLHSPV